MAIANSKTIEVTKPYAWRCQGCGNPLVGRWITNENRPGDPTDDTVSCLKCAAVTPNEDIAAPPISFGFGELVAGLIVGGVGTLILKAMM